MTNIQDISARIEELTRRRTELDKEHNQLEAAVTTAVLSGKDTSLITQQMAVNRVTASGTDRALALLIDQRTELEKESAVDRVITLNRIARERLADHETAIAAAQAAELAYKAALENVRAAHAGFESARFNANQSRDALRVYGLTGEQIDSEIARRSTGEKVQ